MFENVPVSRRERRGKRWSGMVLCSLYEALDGEGEEEGSRGGRSAFVPPQSEGEMEGGACLFLPSLSEGWERTREGEMEGEMERRVCLFV